VRLGEPNDLEAVPSMAIGGESKGVTPLSQAAAYATFASGGTYAEPYLVNRIKDATGKVVWQRDKKIDKSRLDRKEAGVVNGVLQRVVQQGTGTAAAIGRPVAGKTGTTNDSKDVWFVGYTPQLATAVWVGDVAAPTPLKDARGRPLFGGGPPARIFSSTMKGALQGVGQTPFQVNTPEDLGLKLPGAQATATTLAPANGAAAPTTLPLAPGETLPPQQQQTIPTLPAPGLPPPTTATTRPVVRTTTTTTRPCPTTTTGPATTLPAGATTTTTRPSAVC
jgi:penicillin-binding protein 1A